MNANERREEIMAMLVSRRKLTMKTLAEKFNVNIRTIRNDITMLSASYPLSTIRGQNGGVILADCYNPNKNIFTKEQTTVLINLIEVATEYQSKIIKDMIKVFSNPEHYRYIIKF